MKLRISNKEIRDCFKIDSPEFPKYVSPLLNLMNQYAQGTRPKIVGQMSELMRRFPGKRYVEWEKWYLDQKPEAINNATERIYAKLEEMKGALEGIDRQVVQKWVKDLVLAKTFIGLRFQMAILRRVSEVLKTDYRLSEPEEESQGIDGFIGGSAVSIKPDTYKAKAYLTERIPARIVYYRKIKTGIEIDFSSLL